MEIERAASGSPGFGWRKRLPGFDVRKRLSARLGIMTRWLMNPVSHIESYWM